MVVSWQTDSSSLMKAKHSNLLWYCVWYLVSLLSSTRKFIICFSHGFQFSWHLETKVPLALLTLPPLLVPDTHLCWLCVWPSAPLKLNEGSGAPFPRQLLLMRALSYMFWREPAKLLDPAGRTPAAHSFRLHIWRTRFNAGWSSNKVLQQSKCINLTQQDIVWK